MYEFECVYACMWCLFVYYFEYVSYVIVLRAGKTKRTTLVKKLKAMSNFAILGIQLECDAAATTTTTTTHFNGSSSHSTPQEKIVLCRYVSIYLSIYLCMYVCMYVCIYS